MGEASQVSRIGGYPGLVGLILMGAGVATVFSPAAPTSASVSFVAFGLLLFVLAVFGPQIKTIKLPGSRIEMREPDPGQLSQEIEQARDNQPDPADAELPGEDWWDRTRYLVGEKALMGLMDNLDGPLADCQARVFLYDENEQKLMPAYRPPNASGKPYGWRIGEGVTGAAYQYNEYTYADGDAMRDDSWGLDEDTMRRFKDLTAAAAAPLVARDGTIIGVLALSSRDPKNRLTSPYGRSEHLALAQQISICLVDLLWGRA